MGRIRKVGELICYNSLARTGQPSMAHRRCQIWWLHHRPGWPSSPIKARVRCLGMADPRMPIRLYIWRLRRD
jgi:hypothetical protein